MYSLATIFDLLDGADEQLAGDRLAQLVNESGVSTGFAGTPFITGALTRTGHVDGGGRGIRTHETFLPTSFQDWLHRPLGQPSQRRTEIRHRLSLTNRRHSENGLEQVYCAAV